MPRSYNFYRWRNWTTLAVAFLVVFFHRYSTAVVADDLSRELGLSGTQLSNLASMYFYAYALMQLPSGLLSDYVGPRRTTALGMLLAGLGSIAFGFAPGVLGAYLARLMVGLGVSVVFISLLKAQTVWFRPNQFATMTGLSSFVGNIGGILATTPLALLVLSIGWRDSFISIGTLSLGLVALIWFFVYDSPKAAGFENGGNGIHCPSISMLAGLKMVLKNRHTWLNFIIVAGLMSGVMSFSGLWGVPYLMQVYGFDKALASRYVLYLNLGILAGSPFVGVVADKLGRKKPLLIGGGLSLTLFWTYIVVIARGMPPAWILGPLYFAAGLFGIVFMLTFVNVKEHNHPELSGTATGVVNIAGFLATAAANLLIGWLLDFQWDGTLLNNVRIYTVDNFRVALTVLLVFSAVAMAATFFIKEPKYGDKMHKNTSK
jgi:sugar phosphate permease